MRQQRHYKILIGVLAGFISGFATSQILFVKDGASNEATPPTITLPQVRLSDSTTVPSAPEKSTAPAWDPRTPEKMEANLEREVLVRWLEVPGTQMYIVNLENDQGQVVKVYKGSRTYLYLKDIPVPEGQTEVSYSVSVAARNSKGEVGAFGSRRTLRVQAQVALQAPSIEKIKVEY